MQASLLALPQSRNHGPDPCLVLPCGITHEVLGSESHCQAGVNIPHTSLCLRHVLGTVFCIRSVRARKVAWLVDLSQTQGFLKTLDPSSFRPRTP